MIESSKLQTNENSITKHRRSSLFPLFPYHLNESVYESSPAQSSEVSAHPAEREVQQCAKKLADALPCVGQVLSRSQALGSPGKLVAICRYIIHGHKFPEESARTHATTTSRGITRRRGPTNARALSVFLARPRGARQRIR